MSFHVHLDHDRLVLADHSVQWLLASGANILVAGPGNSVHCIQTDGEGNAGLGIPQGQLVDRYQPSKLLIVILRLRWRAVPGSGSNDQVFARQTPEASMV